MTCLCFQKKESVKGQYDKYVFLEVYGISQWMSQVYKSLLIFKAAEIGQVNLVVMTGTAILMPYLKSRCGYTSVAPFIKEVNPRLAKRPLKMRI